MIFELLFISFKQVENNFEYKHETNLKILNANR